jgi:hypothetical protein
MVKGRCHEFCEGGNSNFRYQMEDRELLHRNCEATPRISDLGLKRGFGSCVQVNRYTALCVGLWLKHTVINILDIQESAFTRNGASEFQWRTF